MMWRRGGRGGVWGCMVDWPGCAVDIRVRLRACGMNAWLKGGLSCGYTGGGAHIGAAVVGAVPAQVVVWWWPLAGAAMAYVPCVVVVLWVWVRLWLRLPRLMLAVASHCVRRC